MAHFYPIKFGAVQQGFGAGRTAGGLRLHQRHQWATGGAMLSPDAACLGLRTDSCNAQYLNAQEVIS